MKLEGKVAVVTGAGLENGFGQAIALEMAKEGANVVVVDICAKYDKVPDYKLGTVEDLNKRVAEIKALGRDALAVACDVRSKASVQAMVKAAVKKFGKINILVNNAGFAHLDKFVGISTDDVITSLVGTMPQGKMGKQEDIAKAAVFLASPDSDHITSVALEVSGAQRW